ncbi:hypothetical protein EUGRSUZ_H03084 [Eucalyptus grandis]|uniref:Uncharacterized protein n=2 Tax=Eucalyptus grandis TaxID=71139 RepID=A0ACC3JUR1_EUCGR|nr:hypothetical protein EUGRSUZ_H03084 [Eucalyptus grandis]
MHINEPSNVQKLSRDDREQVHVACAACEGPCRSPLAGALHGGGHGAGMAHELGGDRDAGRGRWLAGGGGLGAASPKAHALALGRQACGAAHARGVVPKRAAWPHGGGACACRARVAWRTQLGLGRRGPPS